MGFENRYCVFDLVLNGQQDNSAIAIKAIGRTPLTYARLRTQMDETVKKLNALGYGRNDRLILIMPNGPELGVAYLSMVAGFTCVPLNPSMPAYEYDFYLTNLNPAAIVTQAGFESPALERAKFFKIPIIWLEPQTDMEAGLFRLQGDVGPGKAQIGYAEPDDIALVLCTSGTTSKPKIVPLTQTNICAAAINCISAFKLSDKDCCLNVMPLYYVQGLSTALFSPVLAGGSVVCAPRFNPVEFLDWAREYKTTWYTAVPAIHKQIVDQAKKDQLTATKLRFIRSAGSAIPKNLRLEVERLFDAPVLESYGMTESSIITANPLPPYPRKDGSVGIPHGIELCIQNDAGDQLRPEEVGEIVLKGPSIVCAYENNAEANTASFNNGWFKTGDLGIVDKDGYVFILGRKKELINRGGEKISPYEVENVLLTHPAISEAAVFPVKSETLGEEVGALIVLENDYPTTPDGIRKHVSERLSFHKVPSYVLIVNEIPKSGPAKKVKRSGLYEIYEPTIKIIKDTAAKETNYILPESEIEKRLTELLEEILGISRVGLRDDFFSLGGNSLSAARLFTAIKREYEIKLSINTIFESPTVEQLAKVLLSRQGGFIEENTGTTTDNIWDSLVPLQPNGRKAPIFCIHGLNGNVMHYKHIIQHIDSDSPVYGIQLSENLDEKEVSSIETLASFYIRIVKTVQSSGPYSLLGHSFSGSVAYEMARQLTENGDKIQFLGIIDTPVRGYWNIKHVYSLRFLATLGKEAPTILMQFINSNNQQKTKNLNKFLRALKMTFSLPFHALKRKNASAVEHFPEWVYRSPEGFLRENAKRNYLIHKKYIPGKFHGKITLFSAISKDDIAYVNRLAYPDMGWGRFASEIETVYIDGDHDTILNMPCAMAIAGKINAVIASKVRDHSPIPIAVTQLIK